MATTAATAPRFGDLLRRYRLAAELTLEALAERAGLSVRGISDLERGSKHVPRRATLAQLMEALELGERERVALQAAARRLAEPSAARARSQLALPLQQTPFIGREREVAAVGELLQQPEVRLLTMSGPGGIGKTRLALQVAEQLRDDFADGVRVVALDAVREPELVVSAIAQAVGVQEAGGQPLLETLQAALAEQQRLLVLDNFEHLLAAGPLVAELLDGCPRLSVLVTSRTVLRLAREHVFEVPPLAVPDPQLLPDLAATREYDAVKLFCERAQAARADFALSPENAGAVVEICQRLDGLPLAIELAAARTRLFAPAALLARLSNRLSLLTGGARDVVARHQTLRGAIDWSYELLDVWEQRLFGRLAVFVGSWTLEAAEAVANPGRELGSTVLDGVAALIDRSLVRQHAGNVAEPRFRMLETIREYGWERLEASGEVDELRCRHAAYYLELAETGEAQLRGREQGVWITRLEQEHDNLRAALRWCVERGESEQGLRLGGALWLFWYVHGHLKEGRERLTDVLGLAEPSLASTRWKAARAAALNGAGALAEMHVDYAAARSLLTKSLAFRRELGDRRGTARSLNNLGNVAKDQGDYAVAQPLYEESLAIFRELGEKRGIAFALFNLGTLAVDHGDYATVRPVLEESLAIFRELGDQRGIGFVLHDLGRLALGQGDYESARAMTEESLAIKVELGERLAIAWSLHNLGDVAVHQSDQALAHSLYRQSLRILRELGDRRGIAYTLEGFARLAVGHGQAEHALRLAGAAARLRRAIGAPLPPAEQERLQHTLQLARQALSEEAGAAAWAEGWAISLEEALVQALAESLATDQPAPSPRDKRIAPSAAGPPSGLSRREQQVAELVARGFTNREIAGALLIGERTVDTHVEHILNKLGLRGRAQVAAWATEHRLSNPEG